MTLKHSLFLRICVALLLLPCFTGTPSTASENPAREIATPAPKGSRQHHLTRLDHGRLLLSWVEGEKPSSRFRFAVRQSGAWSEPQTIIVTRDTFAAPPRVVGLKDGSWAAAWMIHPEKAKDRYAAEIYVALSKDGGHHWSEPRRPYPSAARVYDAQMSVAPLDDGGFALVWTDKRDANRYRLMATLIRADGRASAEKTLDPDVCSCCETHTASNGNTLLTTYRDHLAGEVRDIALTRWNSKGVDSNGIVHADGWVIEGCPSNGPVVASRDARTMVAWFTAAGGVGRVKAAFSSDRGAHFDTPVELGTDANGYVDARLLEDGSAVVAWRGRTGPEEELRVARIRSDGTVLGRASLHRGGFPRWPSRHLSLAQAGDQIYVAWTDAAERRVRLIETSLTVLTAGGDELVMR